MATQATVGGNRSGGDDAPKSNWGKARERLAWLLVAPSLLIVAGVAIYPLFQAFRLSLTDTNINRPGEPSYVWFENYRYLFDNRGNPGFIDALINTFKFTFFSVGLETIFGMAIALIIFSNFKGRGAVRTAMLVPWAIPTVVSSRMWQWMLHDNYGVINDLLVNKLGILDEKVAFLSNASTSLPAIIAVDVWKTTPFMALLLLAGLATIPSDIYEAAKVDGAGPLRRFFRITVPLLRPTLAVALIFRTLDSLRVFDIFQVVLGNQRYSMASFAQDMLVSRRDLGMSSAASMVIFVIIFVFALIYIRMLRVDTR